MNPSYRVQMDICIHMPKQDDCVWMRRMTYLPYVPREGDTVRLLSTDEDDTLDVTFDSVVYNTAAGMFEADHTDESAMEHIHTEGTSNLQELVEYYKTFEFMRVNFPTAQAIRA